MGKKLKPPFLVSKNNTQAKSSWPWLSCYHQRVLSYRANVNNVFKTINPPYITIDNIETTESWFINSSESASFSTASDDSGGDSTETVIKGIRSSERLLFEPGETSSILEEAKTSGFPFKASVVLSMESQDPCVDFRKSMEEMVDAHRLKDWDGLEELLCWYLRVNVKSNRGYIVCAFVDLLVGIAFATSMDSSCSSSHSHTSPLSFYSSSSSSLSEYSSVSPCVSSIEAEEEIANNGSSCTSSSFKAEKVD